jgi:hypothetical protein
MMASNPCPSRILHQAIAGGVEGRATWDEKVSVAVGLQDRPSCPASLGHVLVMFLYIVLPLRSPSLAIPCFFTCLNLLLLAELGFSAFWSPTQRQYQSSQSAGAAVLLLA